jgi:hypothetical protein
MSLNKFNITQEVRDQDDVMKAIWLCEKMHNRDNIHVDSFYCVVHKAQDKFITEKLQQLESLKNSNFIGITTHNGLLYTDEYYIYYTRADHSGFSCDYFFEVSGKTTELISLIKEEIVSIFALKKQKEPVSVMWAFLDSRGELRTRYNDLNSKNLPFNEMYSFLEGKDLHELYEDFFNDTSNILILKGPAGTGKTSFIRGMLFHLGKSAFITYDERLAGSDDLFEKFFSSEQEFIVFEDADAFLNSRTDGNKVMHRFLNMGDGLISRPNKKIIFTTNIESISDIDPALIRPGRCYDVIEFEPLNVEQAQRVAEISGKELGTEQRKLTVAEIFNSQQYRKEKKKSRVGFL